MPLRGSRSYSPLVLDSVLHRLKRKCQYRIDIYCRVGAYLDDFPKSALSGTGVGKRDMGVLACCLKAGTGNECIREAALGSLWRRVLGRDSGLSRKPQGSP